MPSPSPAKLTKFASLSLAAREPCGKVFYFFFLTQVQFIWGLVCPQSGLAMVWVCYGINLRLLHNYQLPILTHINQQIAVLWAKAEIN